MNQPKVSQYIRARKRDEFSSSSIYKGEGDYESAVKCRIQQNQQLLVSLGFDKPICDQLYNVHRKNHTRSHNVKRTKDTKVLVPSRKSKRLAGEVPTENIEPLKVSERGLKDDIAHSEETQDNETYHYSPSVDSYVPENISTPYTLKSIKTTVYHLGKHVGVEDPLAFQFLSHDSCKFKHPYPIGYRATKREFGRIWLMGIERLENASPMFFIQPLEEHQEEELLQGKQIPKSEKAYTGYAPTWPWTQACLKSKSPGRRISGPLYFGFSDPLNVCKVMSLEGGHELLTRYQEHLSKESCKRTQKTLSTHTSQNTEE
ncbi:hypothetical protein GpartN1_g2434.t1 [Galdieria partita]|uniref:Uncharacterized protein n=1 Tax=Galdieria partita TaxID=83374 RepID=A0A9C7UP97_9RHOD|nr:hypothetical protein GpartN1_g2434.t1 [Galdieria partita]